MTESTIIPRVGVGVILETLEGFILLERKGSHSEGTWSWPGGHLEGNESVLQCAAREVFEECGVTMHHMQVLPWFTEDFFLMEGKHYITLYVYGKSCSTAKIQELDKADKMKHVPTDGYVMLNQITNGVQFSGVDESWIKFMTWRDDQPC